MVWVITREHARVGFDGPERSTGRNRRYTQNNVLSFSYNNSTTASLDLCFEHLDGDVTRVVLLLDLFYDADVFVQFCHDPAQQSRPKQSLGKSRI